MLLLELLIYQARYQLNDLREIVPDRDHLESTARKRMPMERTKIANRQNILLSLLVAFLRLVLAITVGFLTGTAGLIGVLAAVVFANAVVYESLRSVRPRVGSSAFRNIARAIWFTVGFGYALRGALGLHLAGVGLTSPNGLTAIAALYCFGVMFVLLTWTLDATTYCRQGPDGAWWCTSKLTAKPHLYLLLRYTGRAPVICSHMPAELPDAGRDKALLPRGALLAPWNMAFISAAVLTVAFTALSSGFETAFTGEGLILLSMCLGSSVATAVADGARWRLLASAGGVAAVWSTAEWFAIGEPLMIGSGCLIITITYTSFRQSSYYDLKHLPDQLKIAVMLAVAVVLRTLIGAQTWTDVGFDKSIHVWRSRQGSRSRSGRDQP